MAAASSLDPAAFSALRLERHGRVLRVEVDNPESETNAMDELLHGEFFRLFHALRTEREARAVLLIGAKGKPFSAGGPASPEWLLGMQNLEQVGPHAVSVRQMIYNLLDLELPIVCAIQGEATASAANIALLCDTIFMAENAKLSDPHVVLGLAAGDGGAAIWPLAMGPALAKRYLLTGDPLTAEEAARLGLVTHVVPESDLDREAMAFAQRLADGAPLAIRYTKYAVNQVLKQAMINAFDVSLALILTTARSKDFSEALTAMGEQREPRFEGV
jgi:enoyl-CoA hydratase/carnithine racemase